MFLWRATHLPKIFVLNVFLYGNAEGVGLRSLPVERFVKIKRGMRQKKHLQFIDIDHTL